MALRERVSSLRRRGGTVLIRATLTNLARAGRLHPQGRALLRRIDVERDVPYLDSGAPIHRLDIYRPKGVDGPLPTLFYVHGGGFSLLSKETHWMMGALFAEMGFTVFNINYRLAPKHPFPAAIRDTFAAAAWVQDHGAEYGADVSRWAVAGESAGGNLVTALTLAGCVERPEPWAKAIFDRALPIRAVLPSCAFLQVSEPERFAQIRPDTSTLVVDRMTNISRIYLDGLSGDCGLADPVVILETLDALDRSWPPTFVPVGGRDPVLDDSIRLTAALRALDMPSETRVYEGGVHAFHAMFWRDPGPACWADMGDFLQPIFGARDVS